MEIKTYGKKMNTNPIKNIITQGESNVDRITIQLPLTYEGIDLTNLMYVLRAVSEKETMAEQALIKTVSENISLTWNVTKEFTAVDGALWLELRGFNDAGLIIKFTGEPILVQQEKTASNYPTPDVVSAALNQMQMLVSTAQESAQIATQKANIAIAAELNPPLIVDGLWWVFDVDTSKYINSGVKAQGLDGERPNHEWVGTSLRFENPDGSWGELVDLKGQDGTGAGDMTKAVYDKNGSGIVDDAEKVNGHTVAVDVPANAKFTDTVYEHPETHPATMITQDSTHRFVSDTEKTEWNSKAKVNNFTAILQSTAWIGAAAPFTQEVNVSGILETDAPVYDVVLTGTYETDKQMSDEFAEVYRLVTSAGKCTFYANQKPTVNMTVQLQVVR